MGATHTDVRIETNQCGAADQTVAILGEKWSLMTLGVLSKRPTMRYSELQRALGGISQRMLTLTVKKLEENGLVLRTVFPTVPPRVDYELTLMGRTLVLPVKALLNWTLENRAAIAEARKAYGARTRRGPTSASSAESAR